MSQSGTALECSDCGAAITPGDTVCRKCGAPHESPDTSEEGPTQTPRQYRFTEDIKDALKIIIMVPGYLFVGVLWVACNVAGLLALPFVKLAEKTGKREEEVPSVNLSWRFQHDHTYIPSAVQRSARRPTDVEITSLRSALGMFSAKKVAQEDQVEILQMKVQEAWILHFCGPDCCPPEVLLKIDGSEYLFLGAETYSHGVDLFADEIGCLIPFTENLTVIRTSHLHMPLQVIRTGVPVVHNARNANVELDFAPVKGFYCEFLRMDLPKEFKDSFTPPTPPMTATATEEGIEIHWEWGGLLEVGNTVVERADAAEGIFESIPIDIPTGRELDHWLDSDTCSVMDHSVVGGRTYWYRLAVYTSAGTLTFGPIAATAK